MRFLADENFPRPTVESLRKQGHDVLWVRTECPGLADRRLIEQAEAEARVLLTLDKDFWQLALHRRTGLRRSGVVLFRVHPAVPENLEPLVIAMLGAGCRASVDRACQHHHQRRHRNDSNWGPGGLERGSSI
jgi:predicted nuclease of predicted toxin-antitoxin system